MIQKNSIVTVDMGNSSSNTFIVDTMEEHSVLVSHPLAKNLLIRVQKDKVNITSATVKDSPERGMDYANANKEFLDYNSLVDLEALGIWLVFKRKFTPRQRHVLADVCGVIASHKFNEDLNEASEFINKHRPLLDDFNLMWFDNFQTMLHNHKYKRPLTKKQRSSVFNIAGYVLAELENPTAKTRK